MTRTFSLPRIETRAPDMCTTASEDFVGDVVGRENINRFHFASRSGVTGLDLTKKYRERFAYHVERRPADKREAEIMAMGKEISKPTSTVSRFVMSLHSAFAEHIPFSLSPEVIQTIISQEVAQYVKDHSEDAKIAALFTTKPEEKQLVVVSVDDFVYGQPNDWLRGISQFREKMSDLVPSDMLSVMTPKLSTGTLETEVTHLVAFMDAASKYYSYGMSTRCGVPSFRLEGTADDWNQVVKSATLLSERLPGLSLYFNNLLPILREIRDTADGNKVNNDFWASIYKEDGGSGGPYSNGWFNNLYAHVYGWQYNRTGKAALKDNDRSFNYALLDGDSYGRSKHYPDRKFEGFPVKSGGSGFGGPKLNDFPSNVSNVPFKWFYNGAEIPMAFVAGVSSVEMDNGFLTPRLGVTVIETNGKE